MLTKEYRIPLPLTVEEYRIAQLYMIAKKSREESKGADSGVEILVNEPYEDGPGGHGQYTHKIYHVGSHLPSWFKGLLPKSALTVEEQAWNAYPYTKTRFSCPFVQKFCLEVETYYCADGGHQDNIFNLSGGELRNRTVDLIDVVKDQLHGADYVREEDPRVFVSQKTGRGPLSENWIEEYWQECKDQKMPLPNGKAIMSAYKLCKVEFHYWGMQSKIERFIHDIALRKTMLRAHRQAWAWQDEWHGLTMEDIREIERETQEALKRKMAAESKAFDDEENENENENNENERHARESSTSSSVGCIEQEAPNYASASVSSCSSTSSANIQQQQQQQQQQNRNQSSSSSSSNPNPNVSGPSNSSSNTVINNNNSHSNKSSHTSSSSTSSCPNNAKPTPSSSTSSGGGVVGTSHHSNKPSAIKFSVSDMSDDFLDSAETTPVFKSPPSAKSRHQQLSSRSNVTSSGLPISKENSGQSQGQNKVSKQSAAKSHLNSPGAASNKSLELLASLRMEGLMRRESESGSEDEFFDCCDGDDDGGLTKWSSLDLIPGSRPSSGKTLSTSDAKDSIFSQSFLQRTSMSERDRSKNRAFSTSYARGSSCDRDSDSPIMYRGSASATASTSCPTTVLCLVVHAGSCLDTNANMDFSTKKSDVTTFRGAFESVIRQHYPSMLGHVSIKLVAAPAICSDALGILSTLSPYSFDVCAAGDVTKSIETIPIGAIPLLAASHPDSWETAVCKTVGAANHVYQEFLKSESGRGFTGQVVIIGDSMGSVLAYDALTKHSYSPQPVEEELPTSPDHLQVGTPDRRRSSSSVSDSGNVRLDFEVQDFFMFGSPLGVVLAYRKLQSDDKIGQFTRPCQQLYNLFHPTDPLAARLEPLISSRFSTIPPMNVPRYTKYPLGDGQPYHLLECIQCNPHLFSESGIPVLGATALATTSARRLSDASIQSGTSGLCDVLPLQAINSLTHKWWGTKRIDFALYCPEALQNFPLHALPHLFHASYWESTDAIAFIIRQIGFQDSAAVVAQDDAEIRLFTPNQPREKWMKKRTSVKLKNVSANHRANDVIVKDGLPQVLRARFAYGPLDLVGLTGEKVDIYVMKDPPAGEWSQLANGEITDKNGRITHTIPPEKSLGYGIYPIKMIVRGDHTSCDFYLAVVPPSTECVVFSIDGSFTASMSVSGRDPRVRAGAVDVVRHWQELGYLVIYVTGRPDMQNRKVVAWLAQHNFPHGFVSFADGLSTDFLGYKTDFLKSLVQDHRMVIHAAYGSSKDIAVYTSVAVPPDKIFIVGKVAKKQQNLATVLNEGYSAHLTALVAHGGSRPASGNARMVIPRGYFGLPGQPMSMRRRRSAKRATSFPVMSQSQGTNPVGGSESGVNLPSMDRSRGISPRAVVKTHLSNKD